MGNTLRLICMSDNGRSWQYRIRTSWAKICLCGVLALLPIAAAGVYGSFFFWHKASLTLFENETMNSTIADMRSRLNRLEVFERILLSYDQKLPRNYWPEFAAARPSAADVEMKSVQSGIMPVPLLPLSQAKLPAAPNLALAQTQAPARPDSPRQQMEDDKADVREERETVVGRFSHPNPTDHVSQASAEATQQDPGLETNTDPKTDPKGAVSSHIEALTSPASALVADASNVRLALEDDSMELQFDLHNRTDTTIAGRISVSFIAADSQIVKADGDHRALRFRIRRFREVRSPLHLPASASMVDLQAMRLHIFSHGGALLYVATYPMAELAQGMEDKG